MSLFEQIKQNVDFLSCVTTLMPDRKISRCGQGTIRIIACPLCGSDSGCTFYEATKTFSCFSCGQGGDIISLVASATGVTNLEAAKNIASVFNVTEDRDATYTPPPMAAPPEPPPPVDTWKDTGEAYCIRAFALNHYQANLLNDPAAMSYQMQTRGHSGDIIRDEYVGISTGTLIKAVKNTDHPVEELERAGLVNRDKNGNLRETFATGCYVYPHMTDKGVAFFSMKDPEKKLKYQMQKKFAPADWLGYGQDALNQRRLVICEGENDRLSIIDKAGEKYVFATVGNYNTPAILNWLATNSAGKDIVLVFDNDTPKDRQKEGAGQKYTRKYVEAITRGGGMAMSVTHLLPPDSDIDDFLKAAEKPREAWMDLLKRAEYHRPKRGLADHGEHIDSGVDIHPDAPPPENPPEPPGPETKNINPFEFESFEVLGELSDGAIVFWCRTKKCTYIRALKELNYDQLAQIGGYEISEKVRRTQPKKDEDDDGRLLFSTVKIQLIHQASKNRMAVMNNIGQGIHYTKDGQRLVVNGGEAFVYEGGNFEKLEHPLFRKSTEQFLIKFEPGTEWIDSKKMIQTARNMTGDEARQLVADLDALFAQWKFRGIHDHKLLTGWFLAQIVQSVWDWRPNLWLCGGAGTGKTKLIKTFQILTGRLGFFSEGGGLTEPGLRQANQFHSRLPYIDEFEKCDHRDIIMKSLRSSGRGGTIIKGSSKGEPVAYEWRHMVMFASIYREIDGKADNDRMVLIETEEEKKRVVNIPSDAKAEDLFIRAVAYAMTYATPAKQIIKNIEKDIDRFEESMSVPLAIRVASMDLARIHSHEDFLKKSIRQVVEQWQALNEGTIVDDEENLIHAIMDAKLKIPQIQPSLGFGVVQSERTTTVDKSVGQILFNQDEYETNKHLWDDILIANGVFRIWGKDIIRLHPERIAGFLLKDTPWAGKNIKDILSRTDKEKCKWVKSRLGRRALHLFEIELSYFNSIGYSDNAPFETAESEYDY